ncbi:SAM-dependent methyltransferase [Sulfitobacter sp. S0837]|uniref:class I SAM-dependent methyltransferase n=1 Tax=Sulfitobacter maritimus TaxID=2741719 RepID=UPI001582C584|nr:SAM-dependent methyltransferase [Sulfitobacter maritimus]NUH65809.1 SAM-dependent methyltransferase [Sulfitobacter maritimus]
MSLKDHLLARIALEGPMRLDDYMQSCLLHPEWGYYTTRLPFGAKGDFTTAPEISQMFGELVGLSLAQSWLDQGSPAPFTLAELGPGRGTLMADILRACARVPGFLDAAQVHLVEASPSLRALQRETLSGHKVDWHDSVASLPDAPLFLVANEFFDALPIRQFIRQGAGWAERLVGATDGALAFGLGPVAPQPALDHRLEDTRDGDLVELCPLAPKIIESIGGRIKLHGGAALIFDYGDWRALGDTFQAVENHQPTDPLAAPGHADLTAHVDFEALAAACPCAHSRVTPQGVFLERLGITARAQKLAETLSGEALQSHIAAHRRLTHPTEMGNLFKAMGLYQAGQAPPPGTEA